MIRAFDAVSLPLLRWLDPEDAHRMAIAGLRFLPPLRPRPDNPKLAVRAFGLNFPNPIGIAAGNAVLDVIAEENLCARAEALGSRLKQRLQSLVEDVPQIADIRGPGFMNAVEFNLPGSATPAPDFANKVRLRALEKGLILLTCGIHGNVIRFLSPLTIGDDIFSEGLDILEASLRECAGEV